MSLRDLVVYGTLGQYSSRVGFDLPPATITTARSTGVGHGSSWHANDIDKHRASSPVIWRGPFRETHTQGKLVAGEVGVAKFNDKVRDVVATKHRERGIRIVLKKAVLSLTPQWNESAGLHMSSHASRPISDTAGHGVHSAQAKLSFAEADILRVLHEEDVHVL